MTCSAPAGGTNVNAAASAFGATGVAVCGGLTAKVSMFGAKGAERRVHIVAFPGRGGLSAAARALGARGIRLVGLEICAGAAAVHAPGALLRAGDGGVAVMPGNEAAGLTDAQKAALKAEAEIIGDRVAFNGAAYTAVVVTRAAKKVDEADEPPRALPSPGPPSSSPPGWWWRCIVSRASC
jgi:hypothetical protein